MVHERLAHVGDIHHRIPQILHGLGHAKGALDAHGHNGVWVLFRDAFKLIKEGFFSIGRGIL